MGHSRRTIRAAVQTNEGSSGLVRFRSSAAAPMLPSFLSSEVARERIWQSDVGQKCGLRLGWTGAECRGRTR